VKTSESNAPDTAALPSGTQIQRADPRFRRFALGLLALGAGIGAWIFFSVESRLPALGEWVIEDPAQAERRLNLIATGVAAAVAVPTLLFARYFWRLGGRVIRSNRFPPPDMRVIRDTVVWHGESARRRGRILQGLALGLTFAVGGLITVVWRVAAYFKSRRR
jgi:hypothetical protein